MNASGNVAASTEERKTDFRPAGMAICKSQLSYPVSHRSSRMHAQFPLAAWLNLSYGQQLT